MTPKSRNKNTEMTFGEILAAHRKAQKYSLRDLGALCDVSPSYLSRLEKGEASATYEIICRIADAFGIDAGEFFPGHGGFRPSYREEFGEILESRPVQVMLRELATLDPYAQRAIAVATNHWIHLLKRGLHPVEGRAGVYKINEKFVEELENLKSHMSP
jgi:transcriptional regulator with XRE-family HTH domain